MKQNKSTTGFDVDFDFFWKEMLDFIEPATRFFLPDLHREVDWSIEYKSLEQELRGPFAGKKGRIKRTDKLFRFQMLNGTHQYVLFHIEAEAYPGSDFPGRMYEYHTYLSVKFDFTPVVMLGVFVGDEPSKPLHHFKRNHFGTCISLSFPTYSIAQQSEDMLLNSDNQFAIVALANWYVIQSKNKPALRTEFKRKLLKILYERHVSLAVFRNLTNFVLYFVRLPDTLDNTLRDSAIFLTSDNKETNIMAHHKPVMTDYFQLFSDSISAAAGKPFEEIVKMHQEGQQKMSDAEQKITEAQQKEKEAQQKITEAQQKEKEAQQKITEAQQKEKEAQQKITEAQQKEKEVRALEEKINQKTADLSLKAENIAEAENVLKKRINNLHQQLGLNAEQIAAVLEMDIKLVKALLST